MGRYSPAFRPIPQIESYLRTRIVSIVTHLCIATYSNSYSDPIAFFLISYISCYDLPNQSVGRAQARRCLWGALDFQRAPLWISFLLISVFYSLGRGCRRGFP